MNLATAIVLLVVLALVIVAIRILRTGRGGCSCSGKWPETSKLQRLRWLFGELPTEEIAM